jgi:hypothetical protein
LVDWTVLRRRSGIIEGLFKSGVGSKAPSDSGHSKTALKINQH